MADHRWRPANPNPAVDLDALERLNSDELLAIQEQINRMSWDMAAARQGAWRVQVTELGDPGDVWMNPSGAACVEADCDWTVEDVDTFEAAREALHDHWRNCTHREEHTDG